MNIGEAWTVLTHNDGVILYSGPVRFEKASDRYVRCYNDPRCADAVELNHSQFMLEYSGYTFTTEPDDS